MKYIFLLTLFFANACVTVPKAKASFAGVDTFGSRRLSAESLQSDYGAELNRLPDLRNTDLNAFSELAKKIESSIKNKYGFAFVNISIVDYFPPMSGTYLTVDVVEPADAARRMDFLPKPNGNFEDPDGALALWEEYEQFSLGLLRKGELKNSNVCPARHCIAGFEDPRLAPYLPKLNALAIKHEKKLVRILHEDANAQKRLSAAYLLAHLKDGNKVTQEMLSALRDSESSVRNSATRVLVWIALKHPEIEIPVEPLLTVLNFPAETDRNKAASALELLSLKESNKAVILHSAGPLLLEMLKLQQPNNHLPAYGILKNISGQNFGERDYQAWELWLRTHQ